MMANEILNFDVIKKLYPNEWVLIGNPELRDPEVEMAIVRQLIAGVLIFYSKDKREIAYKARDLKRGFDTTTCVYTGEIPKGRKFLAYA
jgi:hypothetical protein